MDRDIAVQLQDVTKIYKLYEKPIDRLKEAVNPFSRKYHREFYALKSVSLEIFKGQTVGLIGKNGSGKSTALKIVTGVLTPSYGQVKVSGRISALLELGAGFNPEITGLENIYLNGTIMGFTREEMDRKVESIISFADIGEFIFQPVKTYSSGMFVRLAFSVAINVEPDVLVIDEALSVGDMTFQKKCLEKIDDFKSLGKTILFCSHDMHAVSELCDTVVWFKDGQIAEYGEPRKVISSYASSMSESESIKSGQNAAFDNPHFLVRNSDEVEITSVKTFDSNGNQRKVFYTGEDLVIEFSYTAFEGIVDPTYSILILREDGSPVALNKSNYYKDSNSQGLVKDVRTVRLIFKNLRFNSGKYYFGISVWDKVAKINFALNRTTEIEIRSLNVAYGPMEQKAVFFPEVTWLLENKQQKG